jgi:HNH endonuclease
MDRFYQLEFRHRPVLKGDIGSMLQIEGLVVGGGGASAILLLPSADSLDKRRPVHELSVEEWTEYLQRSDVPEILVGPAKAFHRKSRYEISGLIQQKVYVADGLRCVYCRRPMGQVQLTVDHFVPIELDGKNDETNYLSACRRCNKDKGAEDPKSWCERNGYNYDAIVEYLKSRTIP